MAETELIVGSWEKTIRGARDLGFKLLTFVWEWSGLIVVVVVFGSGPRLVADWDVFNIVVFDIDDVEMVDVDGTLSTERLGIAREDRY